MERARGVDCYHGDGVIDWQAVLNGGISFAFIKATDGQASIDPSFNRNWQRTHEVGITVGAYHFFRPSKDPILQARLFLSQVTLAKSDLPAVIDIEVDEGMDSRIVRLRVQSWIDIVLEATKKHPIVYTSPSFANEHRLSFVGCPLWVANYKPQSAKSPTVPSGWPTWDFWQQSAAEDGASPFRVKVSGCPNGFIDSNVYNGSHADMVARFHLA